MTSTTRIRSKRRSLVSCAPKELTLAITQPFTLNYKRMKKPKLPKIHKIIKLPVRRGTAESRVEEALSGVPRITNETVAEHREAVLSGARKYIYPLQHSKRRIV